MAAYPFSVREQDVIRQLGKSGYRYLRETKKTIEFKSDESKNIINYNREHSNLALVFGFGEIKNVVERDGVIKAGSRASSNFIGLSSGATRTGNQNHQGIQVILESSDVIPSVVSFMENQNEVGV